MAYLDIWDIISERGFWEGDGSGEEVKGMFGFMVLEVLLAGAEELLRGPEGREPASKRDQLHILSHTLWLAPTRAQPCSRLLTAVTRGGCKAQSWPSPALCGL